MRWFHWFLLRLSPEKAHQLFIRCAKLAQFFILKHSQKPEKHRVSSPHPPIQTLDLALAKSLPNRVGLAAGFDKNADILPFLYALGFGFIEVGTITLRPQEGNPAPRLWRVEPKGLINHLGFPSEGVIKISQKLLLMQSYLQSKYLLASIGINRDTMIENAADEILQCLFILEHLVDGFVINISSPNSKILRELQNITWLQQLSSHITSAKNTPNKKNQHFINKDFFIKCGADFEDIFLESIFSFVHASEVWKGVVLTNTSHNLMKLHYQTNKPLHPSHHEYKGGLSGPYLFDVTIKQVRQARKIMNTNKVIIAVGGIDSVEKRDKIITAGANAIEIYTAFIYEGPKIISLFS